MRVSVLKMKLAWLLALFLSASLPCFAAGQSKPDAAAAPTSNSGNGQYASDEVCQTCHSELWEKHFSNTPHRALLAGKEHGCQGCHGPGQAHVDGGGDITKIIRFSQLSPSQSAAICTKCHQSSLETQNFAKSAHLANGLACTSCHDPHNSPDVNFLLKAKQTELCFGCHKNKQAEFSLPYRHRVDSGLIQCSDCHNPHGTQTGRQLRTAAGQFAVCTKCHTDTMGPFVFEHAPVKTGESCLYCHTPHGSTNPRLLQVNNVNYLCLRCHTTNNVGQAPGIPSFHNQTTKYQACTLCHTQIHGSNFSSVFFH